MATIRSITFELEDDEAIGFLNSSVGGALDPATQEVEDVVLETIQGTTEKRLVVTVGPKG
jgi:hypothetical protein